MFKKLKHWYHKKMYFYYYKIYLETRDDPYAWSEYLNALFMLNHHEKGMNKHGS